MKIYTDTNNCHGNRLPTIPNANELITQRRRLYSSGGLACIQKPTEDKIPSFIVIKECGTEANKDKDNSNNRHFAKCVCVVRAAERKVTAEEDSYRQPFNIPIDVVHELCLATIKKSFSLDSFEIVVALFLSL